MSHRQPFIAYNRTGDRFLGSVPSHWEIKPNRTLLSLNKKLVGKKSSDYTLLSLTLGGIKVRDIESGKGKFPESFDTYQEVKPGDLVFCLFDMDETPRTVGLSDHYGMITGAYTVYRPTSIADARFIYYYFLHHDYRKSLKPFYTGLRKVIQKGTFGGIRIALPNIDEQRTIVCFLDAETSRIDTLIDKKSKFIKLLKEKRQAIVTKKVMKGIDVSMPMKESGLEWVGKVPEHWSVKPLFAVTQERKSKNKGMGENNLLSLSYGKIVQRDINASDGLLPESFETYQIVDPDDIVFRLTDLQNDQKSLRTAIVKERGIITSAYVVARTSLALYPDYLSHLLRAYDAQKVFYSMGGGMRQSLKFSDLRRLPLLIPPVTEQKEICDLIGPQTSRIDALVQRTERSIELLKEHRSALITAAVTGKIDVRETK